MDQSRVIGIAVHIQDRYLYLVNERDGSVTKKIRVFSMVQVQVRVFSMVHVQVRVFAMVHGS